MLISFEKNSSILLLNFLFAPFVKFVFFFTIFKFKFQEKVSIKNLKATVFYHSGESDFYLTLISIFSLSRYVNNINVVVYQEKSSFFHERIINFLNKKINISLLNDGDVNNMISKLSVHKNIRAFMEYGWSGRKCLLPLIISKYKKSILIDSDTIFFNKPTEIIEWINKKNSTNLYLRDYKNFSVISKIETEKILQKKATSYKVNSGLICFNLEHIFSKTSLSEIDVFIEKILDTVQTRLIVDAFEKNKFFYVFPLIEQSLHALILNKTKSLSLAKEEYVVLPRHVLLGESLEKAKFIHYTGDSLRWHIYKQLFVSFFDALLKKRNDFPWFLNANKCFVCNHPSTPFWYKLL